jgi:hypothetical protein
MRIVRSLVAVIATHPTKKARLGGRLDITPDVRPHFNDEEPELPLEPRPSAFALFDESEHFGVYISKHSMSNPVVEGRLYSRVVMCSLARLRLGNKRSARRFDVIH